MSRAVDGPASTAPDRIGRMDPALRLRHLYRRTYPFRLLGMGVSLLPVGAVLFELDAGWIAWTWAVVCCIAWPHMAYLRARRSRDPFKAELGNFMIDSAMAGSLAPVMHFNLLPSVMLATVATADKINSGVRGLWPRSLLGMFGAMLAVGAATGFRVDYATSTPVLLACLPLMIVHTLAVSASSYRLVRKVNIQNQQVAELSRHDALTGLQSRGHWQEQAIAMLAANAREARPASLLLVDVDLFKSINDRHGHTIGDDVLRGIADAIRETVPEGSHAGRLGGDEFAVAMPMAMAQTRRVAEEIRARVQALTLDGMPVRCSVSIGMAEPPSAEADLRGWMEAADRALYRAKAAGRDTVLAAQPDEARIPAES